MSAEQDTSLKLVVDDDRWRQEVVDILEILLERAKAGDIKKIMIVTQNNENKAFAQWNGFDSIFERLGVIEFLKIDHVKEYLEKK